MRLTPKSLLPLGLILGLLVPTGWAASPKHATAQAKKKGVVLQKPLNLTPVGPVSPDQLSLKNMVIENGKPIILTALLSKSDNLPIDLPMVVQLVEDQNLSLKRQETQFLIEKNRYHQRQVDMLPNIVMTYNQNRFQGGIQVFGGQTVPVFRTTVQPQLAGEWTLNPGGKQVYDILAQKRRKQAAEVQIQETFQTQLRNATEDYYNLIQAQMDLKNANTSLQEAQQQVALNEARMTAGIGTKLELMRSQYLYAQNESTLIEAANAVGQTQQRLLNRLNLETSINLVTALYEADPVQAKTTLIAHIDDTNILVHQAVKDHPAIQRMDKEISAMGLDLNAIRSDILPSVTLRTYINGTGPRFHDLALSRYGGFSLDMNLLDGMGLKIPLRMQEKKTQIAQKVLERQIMARDVEQNVVNAVLDTRSTDKRIETSRAQLEYAQESFRLAEGRYQAGLGIQLDVLNAQVVLSSARNQLSQSVMDYNRAQVRLLEALGQLTPDRILQQGAPAP